MGSVSHLMQRICPICLADSRTLMTKSIKNGIIHTSQQNGTTEKDVDTLLVIYKEEDELS